MQVTAQSSLLVPDWTNGSFESPVPPAINNKLKKGANVNWNEYDEIFNEPMREAEASAEREKQREELDERIRRGDEN